MQRLRGLVLVGALLTGNWSDDAAAQTSAATPTGTPTLAPVVERVTPAVVNIAVMTRAPEENPLLRDPFFRRFFEQSAARRQQPGPGQQPPGQMSAGSGVVVDAANGYVLTNHHVIANAQDISVTLRDRRRLQAKLIGSDADTDVALLQIPADGLTALPIGDSNAAKVGDYVLAIGNPFGLGQTVTMGIVSAVSRSGLSIEGYEDFIQTDASINPGNSGGGLVNIDGRLIGVNTAILAPSGGNIGIGFAVPSNMARTVMDQLINYGEVRRGRLGLGIQELTPELAGTLGVPPDTRGAVVTQVEPGSPAQKAGIKPGDVVLAVDGQPLRSSADLRNRIGLARVGEEVNLTLARDGAQRTAQVRVGGGPQTAASGSPDPGRARPSLAGASVRDISRDMAMFGKVEGVVVDEVDPGSLSWSGGLRAGDVITAVNRKPVHNVAEFNAALGVGGMGRPQALDVIRGDQPLFLVIG